MSPFKRNEMFAPSKLSPSCNIPMFRVLDCIECSGPRTFLRAGFPCVRYTNHYFLTGATDSFPRSLSMLHAALMMPLCETAILSFFSFSGSKHQQFLIRLIEQLYSTRYCLVSSALTDFAWVRYGCVVLIPPAFISDWNCCGEVVDSGRARNLVDR